MERMHCHHYLLFPTLLNEAEDDGDGVGGLLDDRGVQHVVPFTSDRFRQELSCLASSPKRVGITSDFQSELFFLDSSWTTSLL